MLAAVLPFFLELAGVLILGTISRNASRLMAPVLMAVPLIALVLVALILASLKGLMNLKRPFPAGNDNFSPIL